MEMRKQALEEERRRREDLEKRLQEETSRRQKLIDREVKMREKQRAQVKNQWKDKNLHLPKVLETNCPILESQLVIIFTFD